MASCDKCDAPAEVRWEVTGEESVRQSYSLCSNCMSQMWEQINLRFPGSAAQQQSTFTTLKLSDCVRTLQR